LTDPETARLAVESGADYIGLLFSKISPRAIDLNLAKEIVQAVREAGGEPVGVFADETEERILEIIDALQLKIVQLHGDLPRKAKVPVQVIYVADGKPLPDTLRKDRDFLLFERHFEDPKGFRFFVAGGLNGENVQEFISKYHPQGVDVSSGVEKNLGVKDSDKIKQFIKKARPFGGRYVPEILMQPLIELEMAFETIGKSEAFKRELMDLLRHYAGRPTALTEIPRFAEAIGSPRVFLKREDLLHTGAHKINNAIGQCLLAKKMGKKRVVAETGAGQHGVATATACALLGLECVVYMGKIDIERQAPNVAKMRLLGAEIVSVEQGAMTLKDAVNEAMRDYAANYETTHYCLGSALGPHPYPEMVAEFQKIIGLEAKAQMRERVGCDPDLAIACVGGGSNAIGLFSAYLDEPVQLIGVEAAGAARIANGSPGALHGSYTYLLQNEDGQIGETQSISAGLDYPAIGPQHAGLFQCGRVEYDVCNDEEALAAFRLLARTEGIIPALESSHALGYLMRVAKMLPKEAIILVNLSGRGEKDLKNVTD
jgi:phosphoribosylanthranilate isomerase